MIQRQSTGRVRFAVGVFTFFVLCLMYTPESLWADEKAPSSPRAEMQVVLDQLISVVTENAGEENATVRRDKMRDIIEPKFDFKEMAKRSLGVNWKSITQEEQQEFVDLFSGMLARTYIGRIEKVEQNMVEIKSETLRHPRALVKTIVTFDGGEFPLDYKLIYSDAGWQVYDVIIENIGLISNYRNEFAGIIRKESFQGLLTRLREKENSEVSEETKVSRVLLLSALS